ncbi:MAG: LacI family DNA-binding transcriptional regulator [Dermatophilaceae bacterium]
MTTIQDVAAHARVSAATVSRVLNGVPVSEVLAERVRDSAKQLGFVPNRTARSLRRQASEVIALIIPDIENPFFTSLARGVEDRAQEAGFSVVLCNTDEDPAKEERYIGVAVAENVAGVILAAASNRSDLGPLVASGRPVVAVDRAPHGHDIDAVTFGNEDGGAEAATVLFDRGHRRVACITGPRDVETARQREAGWRRVAAQHDTGDLDALVRWADYRVAGGAAAMHDLLSMPEPPDAVVVTNNLMGIGAVQVLLAQGRSPEEFGVAVFGDFPYSVLAPVGVSVVHLPARNLGVTAADLLLGRIGGHTGPGRHVVLSNEAFHREPGAVHPD